MKSKLPLLILIGVSAIFSIKIASATTTPAVVTSTAQLSTSSAPFLISKSVKITTVLKKGMSGDEVRMLQEYLATFKDIYPEGIITGTFGALTEKAVKRFQEKNGLEQVGYIGPKTQALLSGTQLPSLLVVSPTIISLPQKIFNRNLSLGTEGNDVEELQQLLSTEGFYSGPVTGYFGPLTQAAVKKFQKSKGLEQVGSVGPKTQSILNNNASNSQYSENKDNGSLLPMTSSTPPPASPSPTTPTLPVVSYSGGGGGGGGGGGSPPAPPPASPPSPPVLSNISTTAGTTTATTTWTTDNSGSSDFYYSLVTPLFSGATLHIIGNATTTSHSISLNGIVASTTYYYVVATTDSNSNTSTSSQQSFTTIGTSSSPMISSIASTTSQTIATTTWSTDITSSSDVYYSAVSPLFSSSTNRASSTGNTTSHSVTITSLTASTTYFFKVVSRDTNGNISTSSEQIFTTLVNAPSISSILTIATTTAATTTWTTDFTSSSDVYYSATSPVFGGATTRVSTLGTTTSHSVSFTGLTSSTTYYYLVVSKSNANLTATSTEQSFTTPSPGAASLLGLLTGTSSTLSIQRMQRIGNYMYLAVFGNGQAGNSGITIVDVSNPAIPNVTAYYSPAALRGVRDMVVFGNYAYLTGDANGLSVVDISNPNAPNLVANLTYVGQANPNAISISTSTVYVADRSAGLFETFDVSNPLSPTHLGAISPGLGNPTRTIATTTGYAYVGGGTGTITVINVSNPSSLSSAGTITNLGTTNPARIESSGGNLFIADSSLIIGHLNSATTSSVLSTTSGGSDLHVVGNRAYVMTGSGAEVVDISNPNAPSIIETMTLPTYPPVHVYADNSYVYISSSFGFAIYQP